MKTKGKTKKNEKSWPFQLFFNQTIAQVTIKKHSAIAADQEGRDKGTERDKGEDQGKRVLGTRGKARSGCGLLYRRGRVFILEYKE